MISLTTIVYTAFGLAALGFVVLIIRAPVRKAFAHREKISKLEKALANPDVVLIIQKMLRDPLIRDPKTPGQRRKNKKYALLRTQLCEAVPDQKTRKIIYTVILVKQHNARKKH